MRKTKLLQIDERMAREIAYHTGADVRTVRKVMRKQPVRGMVKERITRAWLLQRSIEKGEK